TRESDNNIGGDRGVRDLRTDLIQDGEELLGSVGTAHLFEHLVRSGLQWHVQLRADVWGLCHGVNDIRGEFCRVRAGEANPLEAFDLTTGTKQLGKCTAIAL